MASCEDCIHEKVCLHRANVQTDTYAYMGVKYDIEKCKHFMPADAAPEVERLRSEIADLQDALKCEKETNARLSGEYLSLMKESESQKAEIERLSKLNEEILMDHRFDRRPGGDCWNDVIEKAKTKVANEIFAEFDLHIRKAVEGWKKQLKFEIEKYKMDMIMARLDAFGYCIYVLNNLEQKYTEGETNGNKAGTEI